MGQQPFGGSRASGTNGKAGTWLNLERCVSPRSIKETYLPPSNYQYDTGIASELDENDLCGNRVAGAVAVAD